MWLDGSNTLYLGGGYNNLQDVWRLDLTDPTGWQVIFNNNPTVPVIHSTPGNIGRIFGAFGFWSAKRQLAFMYANNLKLQLSAD